MIIVVRLYPHYEVEKVWQYVNKHFSDMKGDSIVPLFVSEQDYQNHVSLICEVNDFDSLADFLIKDIAPCKDIAHTRTATMLKPAFHPIPRNASEKLCRFLVPLKVKPEKFAEMYEKLLKLTPPDDIHIAYVAFSLGEEDMLISLLSESRDSVIKFVAGRIEDTGIESIRIGVTHRTKRLVNADKWREVQAKYAKSRLYGSKGRPEEFAFDWTGLKSCVVHGSPND